MFSLFLLFTKLLTQETFGAMSDFPVAPSSPNPSGVVHEKFDPSDINLDQLIKKNHAWAKSVTDTNPDFFKNMALGQTPKILWIGKWKTDVWKPTLPLLSVPPPVFLRLFRFPCARQSSITIGPWRSLCPSKYRQCGHSYWYELSVGLAVLYRSLEGGTCDCLW